MSILRDIQSNVPDCAYHVNIGLNRLRGAIELYKIDTDPEYQRDHVWTKEQECQFVGALLENPRAIPPFWFNYTKDRLTSELVDGKQRFRSCLKWIDGKIAAHCPCGEKVWYKDLDKIDLRGLSNVVVMDWNFVELNKVEVMQFYLRLNCGGTVHKKSELDKVRKLISGK